MLTIAKINIKTENLRISKNKGVTMTELVTVIAVIGILALVVIPAFRVYQHSLRLSGTVRNLIADLRYAQQLTVTEQVEHSVYFNLTEDKYEIKRYGGITTIIKEVEFPVEITEVSITGLTISGFEKEARYNPYGAVKDAGTITLKNTRNATTTIDVRPSGFVRISE